MEGIGGGALFLGRGAENREHLLSGYVMSCSGCPIAPPAGVV